MNWKSMNWEHANLIFIVNLSVFNFDISLCADALKFEWQCSYMTAIIQLLTAAIILIAVYRIPADAALNSGE